MNERIKVLMRTEGHLKMGMGNIYRSIRIAKKFQELYNADVKFVVEPMSVIGMRKILEAGFKVELVDFSKINQYINHVKKFNPHVVINDVLNLEEDYMKELRKYNLLIVNFEDKEHTLTRRYADIVYNSLYEDKGTKIKYFFGPEYVPLRDSFKDITTKKINRECKSILLAFGGSDPSGFTLKVAKILNKFFYGKVIIFLGPSFGYHEQLYDLLKYLDKDKFTIRYDVEYNTKDFEGVDIAIISGGGTCYELAAAGIPAILLSQNDLEEERSILLEKYGTVVHIKNKNEFGDDYLISVIKDLMNNFELRKKMSERGLKLVDGYGADRLVKEFFKVLEEKNILT